MKRYIILRVGKAVLTIWAVYTLVFFLTRVTGDPIEWLTLAGASDSAKRNPADKSGTGYAAVAAVHKIICRALYGGYRNELLLCTFCFRSLRRAYDSDNFIGKHCIGTYHCDRNPLGVLAAVKHNTLLDRITMSSAVVGSTLPNFILGILLIFFFSLKLRILPSGGIGTPQHFLMPVIALSVGPIANVARLTRSSLLDVIGQEHLDCARAKGMREWKVVLKHGLRNALIPVITILGAQLSAMIGGSVVVETVFAWPGIGTLIVSSAQQRDFPVVVFGVLVISASVTFVNLLVDLSYGLLDPRIRDH